MTRTKSIARLRRILDGGFDAFLEHGYRRTRLEDVAARASVSVGTLYLYAAGKEALFELVLRRALGETLPSHDRLPFQSTAGSALSEWVWTRFRNIAHFPVLEAAADTPAGNDTRGELGEILREVWEWQSTHWQAIELIERCARDWPELHLLYYREFRRGVFERATAWVARRMDEGAIRRYPDPATAMRVVAESIAFFAMHRHIRPDSSHLDEDVCRDTIIGIFQAGFDPTYGTDP